MWKLVMLWSGASLLIRSECLLLLIIIINYYYYYIIIIIIIFRVGREYRIYSIDKKRRGGNKGNKSCPKYDKVRIGRFLK